MAKPKIGKISNIAWGQKVMRVYIVHFMPRNAASTRVPRHCYVAAKDSNGAVSLAAARKRQGENVVLVAEVLQLDAVAA